MVKIVIIRGPAAAPVPVARFRQAAEARAGMRHPGEPLVTDP